jgi:hypothetical protein
VLPALTALAGILVLLAGLLAAALLLAGLVLPALLLLLTTLFVVLMLIRLLMLTRILWILAHGHSLQLPSPSPLNSSNGERFEKSLTKSEDLNR